VNVVYGSWVFQILVLPYSDMTQSRYYCVILHHLVCDAINRSTNATNAAENSKKNLVGLCSGSSGSIEPVLSKSSLSTETCPVAVSSKDRGKQPKFEKGL